MEFWYIPFTNWEAAAALAAPKFPPLTGRVVDNAQLVSPETEARLSEELAGLEAQTGRQVINHCQADYLK